MITMIKLSFKIIKKRINPLISLDKKMEGTSRLQIVIFLDAVHSYFDDFYLFIKAGSGEINVGLKSSIACN